MIRSAILAFGAAAALSAPALADYYIVHGPDRRCRVVERYTPGERDIIRIGPLSFRERGEAEREVRVVCKDGYYREEVRREERREERRERRD
jgi:hypothetical protein